MERTSDFVPLDVDTLPERLGAALSAHLGAPDAWQVREVGDGNLNLVFIVEGTRSTIIVKQALPYVRLVGESWPLSIRRAFFEHAALSRQAERAPGSVPRILHFDEAQAMIAMEYLSPHVILRRALIDGRMLPGVGRDLGLFMARTLFRGSDLSMDAAARKRDVALFAGNAELCDITERLVFSDPYFAAEQNTHTKPQLDALVARLRTDRDLKVAAQRMKHAFATRAETLVHGDLHTGSVMVTDGDTRIIDPEFAFYGPMAFDVGMLVSNFWMSFFSQSGHEQDGSRDAMRSWLLETIEDCWRTFRTEFSLLWRTERCGILYEACLFEDQGDALGAEQALGELLTEIWHDLLGFAGVEMHRRILGLAHNADFEAIEDADRRAACEAKALIFGRHLAVNRFAIHSIDEANAVALRIQSGELS